MVEQILFAIIYLSISRNREGAVLQLVSRQVTQNIGKVSGNVSPGSERNLLVAIAANGYFPTCHVKGEGPTPQ